MRGWPAWRVCAARKRLPTGRSTPSTRPAACRPTGTATQAAAFPPGSTVDDVELRFLVEDTRPPDHANPVFIILSVYIGPVRYEQLDRPEVSLFCCEV